MLRDISQRLPGLADVVQEVFNFRGGMNSKASQLYLGHEGKFAMQKDQLPLLVNLLRTSSGALETRPGRDKVNASAVAPPSGDATIRSIFEIAPTSGVRTIIINAGNTVYKWNGSAFVSIGTYTTANARIHWTQFKEVAIGTNGTDLLHRTDGATLTAISGSPTGGTCILSHRNRVWVGVGRAIKYCGLGDETDWTTPNYAGQLPVPTSHGGGVVGLLALWDRMIIFTTDQVFQLTGTSPADFAIDPINFKYGHELSPYGVISAGNDIYFGSRRGAHALSVSFSQSLTGDVIYDYISGFIEPTWQAINSGNWGNVFAVHDSQRSQLLFICSRTGATNSEAFVADYYHLDADGKPTWGTYSNMPFSSGCEVLSLNNAKELLFGGYDGFVYRQNAALADDNGVNIPIQLQYITDGEIPEWDKFWRYLVMYTSANSGIMTVTTSYDFGQHVTANTFDLTNIGGDLLGTTFVIGSSALGVVNYKQVRLPIPGHGRFVTVTLGCSVVSKVTIGGMVFIAGIRRLLQWS